MLMYQYQLVIVVDLYYNVTIVDLDGPKNPVLFMLKKKKENSLKGESCVNVSVNIIQ